MPINFYNPDIFYHKKSYGKRAVLKKLYNLVCKHFRYCIIIIQVLPIGCRYKEPKINKFEFFKLKYAQAINHYRSPNDSLKLKALYFILRNLDDQFYYQSKWINAYGYAISKVKNISINDLTQKRDSILSIYPKTSKRIKDADVITNSYLIRNIDKAFESSNNLWIKDLDFNDFCEYVLPYKIGNEKPDNWGQCLKNESYLLPDSLKHVKDIFEASIYINEHLKWYSGTLNYDYPIDVGYDITRHVGTGTCYSMSRMIAFQARALGLPVSIDYAPAWGNRSDGHSWNVL
ncbi:MAG: hypothetical protein EOP34_11410, partial [Rickettsiales bacterium]